MITIVDNITRRCVCGACDWKDLDGQIQCQSCWRRERRWTSPPAPTVTKPPQALAPAPQTLTRWLKEASK